MNIFNNNTEHYLENKEGHLNVSGNHNVIRIRNSTLTLSVNGNHNYFDIQYSRINLQVNGNNNGFKGFHANITSGFNGNNNRVQCDDNSNFNCQYSNGMNNRIPRPRNNQQYPSNYNQNQGNRNWNGQGQGQRPNRQRTQRQERGQQTQQMRRNQVRNRRQNQMRRPQNINQQGFYIPPPPRIQNQFSMGMGNNLMQQMQASLQMLFNNGRPGRNFMFPQVNNRQNPYRNHPQEEDERGLTQQIFNLLPQSEHQGKAANCTICLDDIKEGDEETFLICFHAFHSECIKDWLMKNAKCPVCQYDLKEYFAQ